MALFFSSHFVSKWILENGQTGSIYGSSVKKKNFIHNFFFYFLNFFYIYFFLEFFFRVFLNFIHNFFFIFFAFIFFIYFIFTFLFLHFFYILHFFFFTFFLFFFTFFMKKYYQKWFNAYAWNWEWSKIWRKRWFYVDRIDRWYLFFFKLNFKKIQKKLVSVVNFGETNPFPIPLSVHPDMTLGSSFLINNNIWGTNYIMWYPYKEEDKHLKSRFSIKFWK